MKTSFFTTITTDRRPFFHFNESDGFPYLTIMQDLNCSQYLNIIKKCLNKKKSENLKLTIILLFLNIISFYFFNRWIKYHVFHPFCSIPNFILFSWFRIVCQNKTTTIIPPIKYTYTVNVQCIHIEFLFHIRLNISNTLSQFFSHIAPHIVIVRGDFYILEMDVQWVYVFLKWKI